MIGVGLTLMGGRGTMTDISDLDERVRKAPTTRASARSGSMIHQTLYFPYLQGQ